MSTGAKRIETEEKNSELFWDSFSGLKAWPRVSLTFSGIEILLTLEIMGVGGSSAGDRIKTELKMKIIKSTEMGFVNADNLQIKQKGNNRPNSKLVSCWGKWWLDLQYNGKKLDVQRGWGWSDERPFPRRGLTFKCDKTVLVGQWTRVYLLGFHADKDIADLRLLTTFKVWPQLRRWWKQ